MSVVIWGVVIAIGIVAAIVAGVFVFFLVRHHLFVQHELHDVIAKCKIQQAKCTKGIATFKAPDDEKYLYDILVRQGKLVENPTGGYSFPDEYSKLWTPEVPRTFARVPREEYQENDIIAYDLDDAGRPINVVKNSEVVERKKAEKAKMKLQEYHKVEGENHGNR